MLRVRCRKPPRFARPWGFSEEGLFGCRLFHTTHGLWNIYLHFGWFSRWWFQTLLVFVPYLGKCSNLTNTFQMGWNHQLVFLWETLVNIPVQWMVWVWFVFIDFIVVRDQRKDSKKKKNTRTLDSCFFHAGFVFFQQKIKIWQFFPSGWVETTN